ncbi:MAG: sensor domain-containing diguanylate cyclase [Planctomycetes bacterium]|nr:sensor domain-containing diguanylate cyclase [Planctomycetota bacterium]
MTPPDHPSPDPAAAQATPPASAAGGADEVAALRARLAAVEDEVARLRGIVRQARDIIVTTDLEGRITEFNEEAEHVLGWSASEVIDQSADRFYVNKRARTRLIQRLEKEESGVVRDDVEVRTKSGERRWLNLSLSWLTDAAGARVGTIGVSKDVTKRRQLEEELRRLSVSDKLTGLFNQSHFFHRLEVEKERAIRLKHDLSLLYFDLDHFKQLNDSLGHREGDQVLVQIGRILFESIRKEVDSAFRYGGDEFTVLLPGADAAQAMRFAERVRRRIEGQDMHGVRASMGICPFDVENRALQLVEKADEAMYVAKRSGGNCIAVYDLAAGKATVCPVPDPSTGQHRRAAKV